MAVLIASNVSVNMQNNCSWRNMKKKTFIKKSEICKGKAQRGLDVYMYMRVCMHPPAFLCMCACMCVRKAIFWLKHPIEWGEKHLLQCFMSAQYLSADSQHRSNDFLRASTQLVHWHRDCMKMMLQLLVTQLWWTTNCDSHVRHHKSASSKTAICEGNLIALVWFLCCFWPSLYYMHWRLLSQEQQNWNLPSISRIPTHHHSLPSPSLLIYNTYACTDGTHAHTHAHLMHTPTPSYDGCL